VISFHENLLSTLTSILVGSEREYRGSLLASFPVVGSTVGSVKRVDMYNVAYSEQNSESKVRKKLNLSGF
jgi:hypothetical protein